METNVCLKEWSPIAEALGKGFQTVLVHGFEAKYTELIIYPTFNFYVANADKLEEKFQPAYLDLARSSGKEAVQRGKTELLVDLKFMVKVERCLLINDNKLWKMLEPYYIWTSDHVIQYSQNRKQKGAYLWLVRAFKLPETQVIGRFRMGGPPDYYRHSSQIGYAKATPIHTDKEHARIVSTILTLCSITD